MASPQFDELVTSLRERLTHIDAELATFTALREERERLVAAIDALEAGAPVSADKRRPRRQTSGRAKRTTRPRGQTQSAVLSHLAEHPGSSASAIADALGLKRNSTSTRLTQMAKSGLIVKSEGRGYELPLSDTQSSADTPADQPG